MRPAAAPYSSHGAAERCGERRCLKGRVATDAGRRRRRHLGSLLSLRRSAVPESQERRCNLYSPSAFFLHLQIARERPFPPGSDMQLVPQSAVGSSSQAADCNPTGHGTFVRPPTGTAGRSSP